MDTTRCWIGIDQGYSQMGLAAIDADGRVLASERTGEPGGNGHDDAIALARLGRLLERVETLRPGPVQLAGYCYDRSGVAEAFTAAGWTVAGAMGLNDVVGVYGQTVMPGSVVVACCGTFSQVVCVDEHQRVCWAGPDVEAQLPPWPLSGEGYARFVVDQARAHPSGPLAARVEAILGGAAEPEPRHHAALGPLLSAMLDDPAAQAHLTWAARTVVQTREILARHLPSIEAVVVGGGAVADDRLWAVLDRHWRALGLRIQRVTGHPAVGLARYALAHPTANPWGFVGSRPPDWLAG